MADPILNFDQLLSCTKDLSIKKGKARLALIGGEEIDVLEAAVRAEPDGIVEIFAIGNESAIRKMAGANDLDIKTINIVDASTPDKVIQACLDKMRQGEIDFIQVGNWERWTELLELLDNRQGLFAGSKFISHTAVFEHRKYPKLLMMSDGFVNVAPGIKSKLAIVQNAVAVANLMRIEKPRVAILAAVEVIYPGMRVTEEGAIISKMVDKGQIKNCYIDGPLSFDVATLPEVAKQKGSCSEVTGQADILIAPDVETGNGIYKAMSVFVKAKTAGLIVGGQVPVAVSSRCDGSSNKYHSLILGAAMALSQNK